MRRRLIWLAVLLPAIYYLLLFGSKGIPGLGEEGLNIGFFASRDIRGLGEHGLNIEASRLYVSNGIVILIALAVGLGVISLFTVHATNIYKRRKEWPFSIIVFLSFAVTMAMVLWQYQLDAEGRRIKQETSAAWERLAQAQALESYAERDAALAALSERDWTAIRRFQAHRDQYRFQPWTFYVDYIYTPLGATVMALLGFYITYAAYRALRIRSLEATVMMLSAAVVILGSDAFGGWLTGGTLAEWADFDNRVLNSGMQRGLLIGIGVATVAASLRIMLGLERGVLDVRQSES